MAKAPERYLLTTKLFCGTCQSMFVGDSANKPNGVIYRYYKCANAKRHECDRKAIRKDWIEDKVIEEISAWLNNDKLVSKMAEDVMALLDEDNEMVLALEAQLKEVRDSIDNIMKAIEKESGKSAGESAVLALDWMNGRRTPDANQLLQGAISGLSLGTSAPMIFRALVEATAYGSKAIVERFRREGVRIDSIIGIGGIALKSPFVMQTLSDVLNMPIKVCNTDQACALGAAMCAATAAGAYPSVEAARDAMNSGFAHEYQPIAENVAIYEELYKDYVAFGEYVESHI